MLMRRKQIVQPLLLHLLLVSRSLLVCHNLCLAKNDSSSKPPPPRHEKGPSSQSTSTPAPAARAKTDSVSTPNQNSSPATVARPKTESINAPPNQSSATTASSRARADPSSSVPKPIQSDHRSKEEPSLASGSGAGVTRANSSEQTRPKDSPANEISSNTSASGLAGNGTSNPSVPRPNKRGREEENRAQASTNPPPSSQTDKGRPPKPVQPTRSAPPPSR
jgi:hypothetical protein